MGGLWLPVLSLGSISIAALGSRIQTRPPFLTRSSCSSSAPAPPLQRWAEDERDPPNNETLGVDALLSCLTCARELAPASNDAEGGAALAALDAIGRAAPRQARSRFGLVFLWVSFTSGRSRDARPR